MIYCQTFADAGVMQVFKCHPTAYCCWTPSLSRCWVFGNVSCFSVLGSPFAPGRSVKRDSATHGTYRKCAQLHLKSKCGTSSFHKQSAGKHLHNRCAAYSLMWGQNKQNHPELEVFRGRDGRDRYVCWATEEREVTQSPISAENFSSRRWEMYICMYICFYVFIQGWISCRKPISQPAGIADAWMSLGQFEGKATQCSLPDWRREEEFLVAIFGRSQEIFVNSEIIWFLSMVKSK